MAPRQPQQAHDTIARAAERLPPNLRNVTLPPRVRSPKAVPAPRGYYKPAALRWPFLAGQLALLAAALSVLVLLQQSMPDSDHSAVVDGRPLARSVAIARHAEIYHDLALRNIVHFKRQTNTTDTSAEPTTQLAAAAAATTEPPINTPPPTSASTVTATTSSTSKRNRAGGLKGAGNNPNGQGSLQKTPEPTTAIDTVDYDKATHTEDVNQPSSNHAQSKQTTITEAVAPLTADPLIEPDQSFNIKVVTTASVSTTTIPASPVLKPVISITGGTTTIVVITTSITPPPRTSTNSAGSTVVFSQSPVQTVQTFTGVVGAQTVQGVVTDDGLTPETSTITAVMSGSSVTLLSVYTPGRPITETLVSVVGGTVLTITPSPTTFVSNLGGGILTTITSAASPYITTMGGTTTTMTQTRTPGRIVTTDMTTVVNGTSTTMKTIVTITPTPTTRTAPPAGTGGSGTNSTRVRVLPGFTPAQYFAVTYLPTFIAACLAVPFGIINTNAKLMQPFHNLATRPNGGLGSDTLNLDFGGFLGVATSFTQAFQHGEPIPLLTDLGAWLSSLLAPLAAEAIGFKVHGICTHLNIAGCGITPGVSPAPATALLVLLVALMMLLVGLTLLLRRWETGVHADPWGLAAVASLSLSASLRPRFGGGELSDEDLKQKLGEERFQLAIFDTEAESRGLWNDWEPCYEYGIVPVADTDAPHTPWRGNSTIAAASKSKSRPRHIPFLALTYASRIIFTAALLGLMALLAYYHQPLGNTAFELFMDSQGFGVRFLFALLGTAIAIFWRSFFQGIATIRTFARMAQKPQPAAQSMLRSPATNSVSGMVLAFQHSDFLLFSASIMAGAAELLLPALLANVPFALTSTYDGHVGSTAGSLAILGSMVAVLVVTLIFSRWPHLPVDPRTLAGSIYYVSRSARLRADLCGRRLALQSGASRDAEVEGLGRWYGYGPLRKQGEVDESRMAVEVKEDHGYNSCHV
ncbi:hypothetical protein B0T16DRAFT_417988 [Cercophora newfieldiana]|uniref:Uncharacterized protein n=1 Tax=Cercophora newfieldiana TaxID=92897 RepID=A0AA40CN34_9PEZI|nr:hypothetical protein B0T16DRAFT_417988 [Cercophora newfieldiana]